MYVKDLLHGLRRRWYLALLGLLVTAGLAAATVPLVPVTYTSTTSILLLPPSAVLGSRGNPYLNLSGLEQALDVLSTRVDATDASVDLLAAHPRVTTSVVRDTTTTGPILLITSTSPDPQESVVVRDQLASLVPIVLKSMQDELGVRTPSQITATVLASDRSPVQNIKDQLRALIVVVAVGGAVTVLGTGYLDVLLDVRSGRRTLRRRRVTTVPNWDWPDPAPFESLTPRGAEPGRDESGVPRQTPDGAGSDARRGGGRTWTDEQLADVDAG